MSLVPIIYTSLLIFSAFLLFVIIVSYISYKAKAGERIPAHMRYADPLGNRIIAQPIPVSNYGTFKQIPVQNSIPAKPAIKYSNPRQEQNSNNNYSNAVQTIQHSVKRATQLITENRGDLQNEKNIHSSNRESYSQKRVTKSAPMSDRLEILNRSANFKTSVSENDNSTVKVRRYTSNGDVNLLNFYSDRVDMDSAAFSTPRISRAI